MSWLKGGKTVAEGGTLSLETSRNDSGIYWCLAKNGVGEVINATAYLDVQCKFGNQTRKIVLFQVIISMLSVKVDHNTLTFSNCTLFLISELLTPFSLTKYYHQANKQDCY